MAIVIFVLVLSFLVLIHELGHFVAARWAGIKVKEFGLGYPPRAKKLFTWSGTDFTFNWIPFGGFVQMDGEESLPGDTPKQGEFYSAPAWKRMVVILAGATVNFVFGVAAFALIFSFTGIPTEVSEPRIGYISPDSPAAEVQLPTEVALRSFELDGEETTVSTIEEVIGFVDENQGQTVTVFVSEACDGLTCPEATVGYQVYLRTAAETPADEGSLGIGFQQYIIHFYPWYEMPVRGVAFGVVEAFGLGNEILAALGRLGTGLVQERELSQELAGPVGIVHQASTLGIFDGGLVMIITFAGLLSINLAIVNVLPIPPLDGGKAVFTLFEFALSQTRIRKVEYWFNYGGWVFLMGLILIITARDVMRLFT
ncbi:MAG: M50 family metallopeptidase [Patescibacteria group bacterium]